MNIDEFIENVSASAKKAIDYGKTIAAAHYREVSGCGEGEAEALYLSTVLAMKDSVITLRCKTEDIKKVIATQRLGALVDRNNSKRKMSEKLIGIDDFGSIYTDCRNTQTSVCGECLFVLSNVKKAVCFNGELARLTNSERSDYVTDPELLVYPIENMAECKAASLVYSIPRRDAVMGSDKIMEMITDKTYDVGHTQVLLFSEPQLKDVESISTSAKEDVVSVRKDIAKLGFLIPVHLSEPGATGHFPKIGTDMHFERDDRIPTSIAPTYMKPGDRVAMKPLPTQPRKLGRISSADGAMVTVHWDDETKGIYDAAEALMRLMPAPQTDLVKPLVSGHGIDAESSSVLELNGIEPDALYSMLSYLRPATPSSGGWKHSIAQGLSKFNLSAEVVSGFRPTGSSFEPSEWIEAQLWSGDRLIVEVTPTSLSIEAGDADDYIVPYSMPMAQIE